MSRNCPKKDIRSTTGNKIRGDNRPSAYEYAAISSHIYRKHIREGLLSLDIPGNKVWRIRFTRTGECGYFGAIYVCDESKQVVVAHRGTNSIKDILEDIRGIFFNQNTPQKSEALYITRQAIDFVREYPEYHLSATGHSLGAFLAEFTVYFVVTNFPDLNNTNAVTFESPGNLEQIKSLLPATTDFVLPKLDIITYFGYPNLINTCNGHIGTKYMINVDLGPFGWWPVHHLLKSHSSNGITEWFEQSAKKNSTFAFNKKRCFMNDWPKAYFQKNVYFKYADFENGRYTFIREIKQILNKSMTRYSKEAEDIDAMKAHEKTFNLRFKGNFKFCEELSPRHIIPTQHLFHEFQNFLREFYAKVVTISVNKKHKDEVTDVLEGIWKKLGIPESIISSLKNLKITKHKYGIEALEVGVGNDVCVFRHKFSNWLEKHSEITVNDLVPNHLKLYFNIRQNHIDGTYVDTDTDTCKTTEFPIRPTSLAF